MSGFISVGLFFLDIVVVSTVDAILLFSHRHCPISGLRV